MGKVPFLGGLSKGSYPVFTRVSEKIKENSERLGRQARPGFEPGTSHQPVFKEQNCATFTEDFVSECLLNAEETRQFYRISADKTMSLKIEKCQECLKEG